MQLSVRHIELCAFVICHSSSSWFKCVMYISYQPFSLNAVFDIFQKLL